MAYDMVSLLKMLIDRDGSDLHLGVGNPPIGRVHGRLQFFGDEPLVPDDTERLMKSIASVDHQQELGEVGSPSRMSPGSAYRYSNRRAMSAPC
jgi:twitching motility protein PilT